MRPEIYRRTQLELRGIDPGAYNSPREQALTFAMINEQNAMVESLNIVAASLAQDNDTIKEATKRLNDAINPWRVLRRQESLNAVGNVLDQVFSMFAPQKPGDPD